MECEEPVQVSITYDSDQRIREVLVRLAGKQEVRRDKGGAQRAGDCTSIYGKGNENNQLWTGLFCT